MLNHQPDDRVVDRDRDRVICVDGRNVHVVENGPPSAPALLLIHGFASSTVWWDSLVPELAQHHHVIRVDLLGHGRSDSPADGYTIDQFAADVVAFMDAIGIARATLIGHSMGTFIARRVAQIRPKRVARLAFIGSSITALNDVTLEVQEGVRPLADPLPLEFVREFQASALHIPVPEQFFAGIVSESLKAPARVWQSAFDGLLAFDDAGQLERITAPTLILWGEQDALFAGVDGQQRLAAAIPGAQLTVYSETGHSPNWERPERVAADLEGFVGSAQ